MLLDDQYDVEIIITTTNSLLMEIKMKFGFTYPVSILTGIMFIFSITHTHAQDIDTMGIKKHVTELEVKVAGREGEPAESVFKNIQTLKGVPAGRLLKIMQFGFSKSLGVDCSHCHNPQAWESDEKDKKEIARKMWIFAGNIRKDLASITNKRVVVNCFTCHRGKAKPEF